MRPTRQRKRGDRMSIQLPSADAALVVVDVQRDFCPGGRLAVPRGDQVVPVINRWVDAFVQAGRPVAYTQDWHPDDHVSFDRRGGPWPPHCVQGTAGADFHPHLKVSGTVFRKAFDPDRDAYSGFEAVRVDSRGNLSGDRLPDWLVREGARHLLVVGLATDYCVRATALDALHAGFDVSIDPAACRAVNVHPDDERQALAELRAGGAHLL
jgi:nicotinamidase/pyrazinamidase